MTLWARNLHHLARHPLGPARALAQRLAELGPAPDHGVRSRSGAPLPHVATAGAARSLVSTFDAGKEALRWAEGARGTVAVLGAAGVAAFDALEGPPVRLRFWVEPRLEVWRAYLTFEDWGPRLERADWVPVDGPPAAWGQVLAARYQPVWDGAFETREWRGAGAPDGGWEPWLTEARSRLDAGAADFSTQARFGERWYRNALRNLRDLAAAEMAGCEGRRVLIAGAGPTLEDRARPPRDGEVLWSTDTALPALVGRGLVPDAVFSLDGQLPTYHHYVAPFPTSVPVVADLASLPLLGRLGHPVLRFLSAHPLGAVIRREFPELPTLDGSSGHVSGLIREAARAGGAVATEEWGVDFGYRRGQAYARGTYPYDLAARSADRWSPFETRLTRGSYASKGREREVRDGVPWDTTPLLRQYAAIVPRPLPGPPSRTRWSHGSSAGRWDRWAEAWDRSLQTLPLPPEGTSLGAFVARLSPEQREDWGALGPLALALHRTGVAEADLCRATVDRARSILQD